MMELYEQEDYLGVVQSAHQVDRYHLTDAQILLLTASYYHLGRKDISYLKSGVSFLLPLEHSSLNSYAQWHFYMGMSLNSICNYARAFRHFHEFLALNVDNQDEMSKERQKVVQQKLTSCQAFLTLPFFNQTFADRVKHFWLKFDNLIPIVSLYVDKLNHVKTEDGRTRSRSLHGSQQKCAEALEQIKMLLGSLLPGQKFSVRFLTSDKTPAKVEFIFPIGRFIARMHALKYFVSQANIYSKNSDQFICTIGIPIHDHYDCHFGGTHITANDVNVFIRVDEHGHWQDDISRQIILYSTKLNSCTDVLRAHLLTQILYHNSGELAIHTYFDEINVIDDHDNEQMLCLIAHDKLLTQLDEQNANNSSSNEAMNQENEQALEPCSCNGSTSCKQASSSKGEATNEQQSFDEPSCESLELLNESQDGSSSSEVEDRALEAKFEETLKSKQRSFAYNIDEHNSWSSNDNPKKGEHGPCFCRGNASCLVVKDEKHYLQIPLRKFNSFLKSQGLVVEHVDFNEYWLTNRLDIFSDHMFACEPGANAEIDEEIDEAIALRLEAFWTLTSCYELEDFMNDFDQSSAISCYDWGIMPCFLIVPLSNFAIPDDYYEANNTIAFDKLEEVKKLVIDYKSKLIKRLLKHCKNQTFSCTGLALSHEFVFIDFMLWQPFCALDGLHQIFIEDGFEDVGVKSFHPFTSEMDVGQLNLSQG